MIGNKKIISICLIGPVPPPYGGMSVQTVQLGNLLQKEGLEVKMVPVNLPFPKSFCFIDNLKYVRAVVRLLYYMLILCKRLNGVDLVHILSNSYLNFFLYTVPATIIGKLYHCKIIINYRGGQAQEFFEKHKWTTCRIFKMADAIVVPSAFLKKVFKIYNFTPDIVPNIINLERFFKVQRSFDPLKGPVHLLITRNLETIYNVPCAIRAFQYVQKEYPHAKLTIIGEGSEELKIKRMVSDMGLDGVIFLGKVNNQDVPEIYKKATIVLNPSDADNFPISILEAFASEIPIVSTNVGGIPYLIKDGVSGFLVNRNDDKEMAKCVLSLLENKVLYQKIYENGHKEALKYSWKNVRPQLFDVYKRVLGENNASYDNILDHKGFRLPS